MQTAALRAVLSAVDNMSPVLKKINITAAFTRKGLMDLSKSTSHLMDTVGKPLALLSGGVGIAGLLAGTNGIIGVSSQFEDFTATLETLMGSSEKAKQSMNWIKDFAKTTPFVLADTTAAFVTLRTFGLDPTKGALKATGDIASLFNKPLEEATNALASAMRGNTEMLDNFGIQGKIIGDKMRMVWDQKGKPFGTYVSKDDNKAIAAAVTAIWERIAGGNMEKKALRWNGIMSDLSDSWTNFLRTIGDAGSFEYAEKHITPLSL